jgi:hypothetical protein
MVKLIATLLAGLFLGFVFGYWLHGTMTPPFGSARGEERVLTRELDLTREYAFAPDKPYVSGVISRGSHFTVDFPKSEVAMYVSFETVLSQRTIRDASVPAVAEKPKPSPN